MQTAENRTRYLVIGANGLVGGAIVGLLTAMGRDWTGTFNKRPGKGLIKLDITSSANVDGIFSKVRPGVVVHCANLAGGVDFCEANPQKASAFHLDSAIRIARSCSKINAVMVFLSTDYVFDGAAGPYREEDPANPLNLYGRLKLEAEGWIRNNMSKYIIVRTTNVFGWDPLTVTPNYMMGMLRTVKEGRSFNAPSFLRGNPTYAGDLAAAILELCSENATGVFHVVGKSLVDRYDWALAACGIFGLDSSLIRQMKEPPHDMVKRPFKSWLNTDKFTGSHRTTLHDMYGGLKLMKRDMETALAGKSAW